ncbi:MAG: tRNA lysidine(34) synthetase TilS, partial [Oscillospiraceae bacterium]|nr:tRNA lysidine(34) synthetase TilS [Oscillospiraceae bacterium]
VRSFAAENAIGLEDAARRLRYDFLRVAKEKLCADVIATAHNADDNAETVLMRLARGTGAKGLTGIPPKRGDIIRPILFLTRDEIEAYLRENSLPHIEDSTNAEDIYTRNRLRHSVMPVMRGINPAFSSSVAETCELLRRDDDYLTSLASDFAGKHGRCVPVSELCSLPAPVASRAVRIIAGRDMQKKHVDSILAMCGEKSSSSVDFPGGRAEISCGRLSFTSGERLSFEPFEISVGESRRIGNTGLTVSVRRAGDEIIHKSFTVFIFKSTEICGTITVRPRSAGDSVRLKGHGVTKPVRKLMMERRIPRDERELVPVIADEKGILGVCFCGEDERGLDKSEKESIIIMFEGALKHE